MCADVPLSGEGHRISAAFEGAVAELQGSEVKLAVVDVAKEKDLAKELNVTGLATIRLYLAGDKHNPVTCPGASKYRRYYVGPDCTFYLSPAKIHKTKPIPLFMPAIVTENHYSDSTVGKKASESNIFLFLRC